MSGIELDQVALDGCATGLDGVAEKLHKAIEALETVTNQLEGAWGTGPVGSTIGELYLSVQELALGCYEGHGEVIGDYVAALDGTIALMEEFRLTMEKDVGKFSTAIGEIYSGAKPQ